MCHFFLPPCLSSCPYPCARKNCTCQQKAQTGRDKRLLFLLVIAHSFNCMRPRQGNNVRQLRRRQEGYFSNMHSPCGVPLAAHHMESRTYMMLQLWSWLLAEHLSVRFPHSKNSSWRSGTQQTLKSPLPSGVDHCTTDSPHKF